MSAGVGSLSEFSGGEVVGVEMVRRFLVGIGLGDLVCAPTDIVGGEARIIGLLPLTDLGERNKNIV